MIFSPPETGIAPAALVLKMVEVLSTGYLAWTIVDEAYVEDQVEQDPELVGCTAASETLSSTSQQYYLGQMPNWREYAKKELGPSLEYKAALHTIKKLEDYIAVGGDETTPESVTLCSIKVGFLIIERQISTLKAQRLAASSNIEATSSNVGPTLTGPLLAPLIVGALIVFFISWGTQ